MVVILGFRENVEFSMQLNIFSFACIYRMKM